MSLETIKKLTIEGFKSIKRLEDFDLRPLNVLIGANGAGKSNFVGFFRLLRELIDQQLQLFVETSGGADALLHLGPKITKQINAKLYFGDNGYEFTLVPTNDNRLVFGDEATIFLGRLGALRKVLDTGQREPFSRTGRISPALPAQRTGRPITSSRRCPIGSYIIFTIRATQQEFVAGVRSACWPLIRLTESRSTARWRQYPSASPQCGANARILMSG